MHLESIRLARASGLEEAQTLLEINLDRRVNLFIGPNSTGKSSLIGTMKKFNSFIYNDISGTNGEAISQFALSGLDPFERDNSLVMRNSYPVFGPTKSDAEVRRHFFDAYREGITYFAITQSTDWPLYLERYYNERYFGGGNIGIDASDLLERLRLRPDDLGDLYDEPAEIELLVREYRLSDSVPFLYVPAVRLNLSGLKVSDWTSIKNAADTFRHLPGVSSLASMFEDPMETLFDINSEVFYGHYVEFVIQWLRESMASDRSVTQDQIYQLRKAVQLGYSCSQAICSEVIIDSSVRQSADYPRIQPSEYLLPYPSDRETARWVRHNENPHSSVSDFDGLSDEEIAHGNFPLRYSYPFKIMNDNVTVIVREADGQLLFDDETEVFIQINDEDPIYSERYYGSVDYHDAADIAGTYYSRMDFYRKELISDIQVESNLMIRDPYLKTLPAAAMSSGTQGTLLWILALSIRMASHHDWQTGWEEKPAILLIDEIENHLHPTWQRRVIPALLEHFPGLQIFATTHSPFVVAGLKAGQVHKLTRDANGVVTATTNTEDITGWTSDRISREMLEIIDPVDEETAKNSGRLRKLRQEGPRADAESENERQKEMAELRNLVNLDSLAGGPRAARRELFEQLFTERRLEEDLN